MIFVQAILYFIIIPLVLIGVGVAGLWISTVVLHWMLFDC